MPAYEYIEDFVYDTMEKGLEFGEQLIERNSSKRRRLSSSSC